MRLLDPSGGYDNCGVFSGAAASLHVLTRKGCPFTHPVSRAGLCCPPQVPFWSCLCQGRGSYALPLLAPFLGRTVVAIQGQHPIREDSELLTLWFQDTVARGMVTGWGQDKLLAPPPLLFPSGL